MQNIKTGSAKYTTMKFLKPWPPLVQDMDVNKRERKKITKVTEDISGRCGWIDKNG